MMPADRKRPAVVQADGATRSTRRGDVPEEIMARYLSDAAPGRTLGFYIDARVTRPAFRDRGDRLFADRNDPSAIRAMMTIAAHRGWTSVRVSGEAEFRREAWLEARRRGLAVVGYSPTQRDLQVEARRTADRRGSPRAAEAKPAPEPMTPQRRAAIVEAVVAARMLDPERGRRLLEAARARLAPVIAAVRADRAPRPGASPARDRS